MLEEKYIMDILAVLATKQTQTGKPAVRFAVIQSLLCDQKMRSIDFKVVKKS